jgi:hypothetical protein
MLKVRSGTGTDAFFIMHFCSKSLRVTDSDTTISDQSNKPVIKQLEIKKPPAAKEFGFTV